MRGELEEAVNANGGVYAHDLIKARCTHLVAASTTSTKYKHAHKWEGVSIVTRRWLDDCIAAKARLDESDSKYAVADDASLGGDPSFPASTRAPTGGGYAGGGGAHSHRPPGPSAHEEAMTAAQEAVAAAQEAVAAAQCKVKLAKLSSLVASKGEESEEARGVLDDMQTRLKRAANDAATLAAEMLAEKRARAAGSGGGVAWSTAG